MHRDLHRELIEGRTDVPRVGAVIQLPRQFPPYAVADAAGTLVAPVESYLKDLALGDNSPATCRSYANDLLRWFRLLWLLGVDWEEATEAEAATMVGWLRTAKNPQRRRSNPASPPPGSVNPRTGKQYLRAGYAPTTINHTLTVVSGFYAFHRHYGRGPVVNPVPESVQRRMGPRPPQPGQPDAAAPPGPAEAADPAEAAAGDPRHDVGRVVRSHEPRSRPCPAPALRL